MENRINRREFLVVSSTAAAGLVAMSATGSALERMSAADAPFVSVGFWSAAGARTRGVGRAGGAGLLPAETLTTSDASLISTGTRLSLRGFWAAAADPSSRTVSLQVAYPTLPGNEKPLFSAWFSSVGTSRPAGSNALAFNVPVEALDTIDLVIERASAGAVKRNVIPFSVNPAAGCLRLNRGVYAIALRRDGAAAPDWSTVRLRDTKPERTDPRGEGPLLLDRFAEGRPFPFDYFLVSFDTPRTSVVK